MRGIRQQPELGRANETAAPWLAYLSLLQRNVDNSMRQQCCCLIPVFRRISFSIELMSDDATDLADAIATSCFCPTAVLKVSSRRLAICQQHEWVNQCPPEFASLRFNRMQQETRCEWSCNQFITVCSFRPENAIVDCGVDQSVSMLNLSIHPHLFSSTTLLERFPPPSACSPSSSSSSCGLPPPLLNTIIFSLHNLDFIFTIPNGLTYITCFTEDL